MLVRGNRLNYISNFLKSGKAVQVIEVSFPVKERPKYYIFIFFKDQGATDSTEVFTIAFQINFFREFEFWEAYCLLQETMEMFG